MLTWCSQARQNQWSLCCTEETHRADVMVQYLQRQAKGNLWLGMRNTSETQFQLRDAQIDRQPDSLTLHLKECTHRAQGFDGEWKWRNSPPSCPYYKRKYPMRPPSAMRRRRDKRRGHQGCAERPIEPDAGNSNSDRLQCEGRSGRFLHTKESVFRGALHVDPGLQW